MATELNVELAYKILENVDKTMSNMNELVNDRPKTRDDKINKNEFLLTLYFLEKNNYLLRYQSEGKIRYFRTEKGQRIFERYAGLPKEKWPKKVIIEKN
ncbi:DUF3116 family protein [Listeria sp. PSOL-1]|uniref:DUF3116 family protein n=1 Tax=Listeria sp. PSOL-1 TaxID=1844999 RepID=UPI0013D48239|nr:DUF3116 family protein [Listeria sp. PSOL-1]